MTAMGNSAILPLEERAAQAALDFAARDEFPWLSIVERAAFHGSFQAGFRDAANGLPAKGDWTSPLDADPDPRYNRDSYDAGYAQGGKAS
jgi:hypothetical protein